MRSAFFALLLCLASLSPPNLQAAQDDARRGPPTYAERAEAEKTSRSRYRDLEVASLVLIIVVGGAAILWAVRNK